MASYDKLFFLQEKLIEMDTENQYIKTLPQTMDQLLTQASLIEQFEEVPDEAKARFLIKLVAMFNRQLGR